MKILYRKGDWIVPKKNEHGLFKDQAYLVREDCEKGAGVKLNINGVERWVFTWRFPFKILKSVESK